MGGAFGQAAGNYLNIIYHSSLHAATAIMKRSTRPLRGGKLPDSQGARFV